MDRNDNRHPEPIDLPPEVVEALQRGAKIEAIKRLREARGLGLKQAKGQVETWRGEASGTARRPGLKRIPLLTILLVISFVWAMVTCIDAVSSLIVLANLDGYRPATFIVNDLRYEPDGEGGLNWGFDGDLDGQPVRLYAPHLADGRALGASRLRLLFPAGTAIPVWFNPDVTATLFQGRTINIVATDDLKATEQARFRRWALSGLLPLVLLLLLCWRIDRVKHPQRIVGET